MNTSPPEQDLTLLQEAVGKWLDSLNIDRLSRGSKECSTLLLAGIQELGLCGLAVDERHGGAGLGLHGIAAVTRQIGARRLISPLLSYALLAHDVIAATGGQAATDLLAEIAAGQRCLAVALPDTHCQPKQHGGDEWTVSGSLRFVPDTELADGLLLLADSDQHITVLLVDKSQLDIEPLAMIDGSDYSHVGLGPTTKATCLGTMKQDELAMVIDRARLALASEMLGLAETTLAITCEYLRSRQQFGQKIGSFQGLQHRLAKAYINNQLASASICAALHTHDAKEFSRAATVAKAMAGDALHLLSNECVQMHGGIGMTDEHISGHYLKRARVLEFYLGDKTALEERYATIQGFSLGR